MNIQDNLTKILLVLFIVSLLVLGCQLITGAPPNVEQDNNEQELPLLDQPNQPEVDSNQGASEEGGGGEINGAGPTSDNMVLIETGGLELFYDAQVILEIQPQLIQNSPPDHPFEGYPTYMQYILPMDFGRLEMVDIPSLQFSSDFSGEVLANLEEIIEIGNTIGLECIPEVPLQDGYTTCGHQQFYANAGSIDFKNGTGVRFVGVYGIQDMAPADNENLVYVYQGISANGECYLKGRFRISHSSLPDQGELPREVYLDMSGNVSKQYFEEIKTSLEADPGGYFPNLEYLDRIIESIATGICGGG